MERVSFEVFRESLSDLRGTTVVADETRQSIEDAAATLAALPVIDRQNLAELIRAHPAWVPVLGSCVRLSYEGLRNQLKARIGTAAWTQVAQRDPLRLIIALDEGFALIEEIKAQRERQWTFADILVERYSSRSRAAGSIVRGRSLEDEVEAVAAGLHLEREMRTRCRRPRYFSR